MNFQPIKRVPKIFLIALMLGLVCLSGSCGNSYSRKVISDKQTKLAPDWVEFLPDQPLGCELDTHEIILEFATSFKVDTTAQPAKMILDDNSAVNPEIQVTDTLGRIYPLSVGSFRVPKAVVYTCNGLPIGAKIRSVQARSNKPLELSSLQWLCYNFRDIKR